MTIRASFTSFPRLFVMHRVTSILSPTIVGSRTLTSFLQLQIPQFQLVHPSLGECPPGRIIVRPFVVCIVPRRLGCRVPQLWSRTAFALCIVGIGGCNMVDECRIIGRSRRRWRFGWLECCVRCINPSARSSNKNYHRIRLRGKGVSTHEVQS